MLKKYVAVLIYLALLLPLVSAYEINYNIEYNKVLVEVTLESQGTELLLPEDASAVSITGNNEILLPEITGSILKVPAGKVKISYITKTYLEKGKQRYFITEFMPLKSENSIIKLTLPESAAVEQNSIFPMHAKLETDGKKITIVWEKQLSRNEQFSIFVKYNQRKKYEIFLIPLAIIILALFYFLKKKPKLKIIEKTKVVTKNIEEHLKPDEKTIINALKKKEGECEQATLRIITDFSKASLSRLLKDMEQRKLIKKVRQGKKNIVKLKK